MSTTDRQKVLLGSLLLVAGTIIVFGGQFASDLPRILGSLAMIGLAAGALLLGTADQGRPV
jgi:hypothetical protein